MEYNPEKKSEYYLKNIESIRKSRKEYYHKNKDKIKEYRKKWVIGKKEKLREYSNKYLITHKSHHKNYALKRTYGITLEDFNELLKKQNNVCAICGGINKRKTLFVDHCHSSKKIRGLLCINCNRGLGSFKDDTNNLKKAIIYLKKYGK